MKSQIVFPSKFKKLGTKWIFEFFHSLSTAKCFQVLMRWMYLSYNILWPGLKIIKSFYWHLFSYCFWHFSLDWSLHYWQLEIENAVILLVTDKAYCYSLIYECASTLKDVQMMLFVLLDCLKPQSSQYLGRCVYMGDEK